MKRSIEEELNLWKDRIDRKPLILRGARQIGKTYIVEKFGKESFESIVTVNFEELKGVHKVFENDLKPSILLRDLSASLTRPIVPGKTLLFFDEIQSCPNALLSLRFFKEQIPDLHLIAAGSLLEFTLKEDRFSFPVGRVEYLYMRPLSFIEFLEAKGGTEALSWIQEASIQNPIGSATHESLLNSVKEYFIVGGMPEAVNSFIRTHQFLSLDPIHQHLLHTYENDLDKYPKNSQQKFMKRLFSAAPRLICDHFKYAKIDPHAQSRDYMESLDVLSDVGILHRVFATSASGSPLQSGRNEKKFKLLFLDIGLLPHSPASILKETQLSASYRGNLAEQFVGQELIAYEKPYRKSILSYWEREKKGADAEVDYVIEVDGLFVPIEVKAGATGKLRSLKQFLLEKNCTLGLQISEAPLKREGDVLSVPFYMIDQIPRLVGEELLREKVLKRKGV